MRSFPDRLREALDAGGRNLGLLVLRFGALGDILRTVPAVRLVRRALPHARITWLLDEGWRTILEGQPDIDEIRAMPRRRWRELSSAPWRWPGLVAEVRSWFGAIRRERPGLVLDFHGNLRSGLAGRLSGAPIRLGYAGHQQKEGNRWFTTHRVAAGPRRVSRVQRNLELVKALGIPEVPLPGAGLVLPDGVRRVATTGVADGAAYGVLSPGASTSQAYKRPPARLLEAAARALHDRGVAAVVVWGPGEEAEARAVVERSSGVAKLAPSTSLHELAALLQGARIFVGGDSGPMHLACAMGCPVVAVYGPTDPVVNAPWGVVHRTVTPTDYEHRGIKRYDRRLGRFDSITSGAVAVAVNELLDAS